MSVAQVLIAVALWSLTTYAAAVRFHDPNLAPLGDWGVLWRSGDSKHVDICTKIEGKAFRPLVRHIRKAGYYREDLFVVTQDGETFRLAIEVSNLKAIKIPGSAIPTDAKLVDSHEFFLLHQEPRSSWALSRSGLLISVSSLGTCVALFFTRGSSLVFLVGLLSCFALVLYSFITGNSEVREGMGNSVFVGCCLLVFLGWCHISFLDG